MVRSSVVEHVGRFGPGGRLGRDTHLDALDAAGQERNRRRPAAGGVEGVQLAG